MTGTNLFNFKEREKMKECDNFKNVAEKFKSGSNCAQAVLSVYFPLLDLDDKIGHKMGAGLGAGIGRKQYVCGAVNAGAIILSLFYGDEEPGQKDKKKLAYEKVRNYIDLFEREFGTSQCREIIGVDIATAYDRKKAEKMGLFKAKCVPCIKKVCEILDAEIIAGQE